jgi:TRAP-type C4-dicarboxylate transport system permease small subunit
LIPAASGLIHNVCAIGFFGLLAYNSYFLFTKTNGNITPNKLKRNIIFRVCGIGMAASFLAIIPVNIFNIWGGVWLVETIALAFFGVSWLTKANRYRWLFADKE